MKKYVLDENLRTLFSSLLLLSGYFLAAVSVVSLVRQDTTMNLGEVGRNVLLIACIVLLFLYILVEIAITVYFLCKNLLKIKIEEEKIIVKNYRNAGTKILKFEDVCQYGSVYRTTFFPFKKVLQESYLYLSDVKIEKVCYKNLANNENCILFKEAGEITQKLNAKLQETDRKDNKEKYREYDLSEKTVFSYDRPVGPSMNVSTVYVLGVLAIIGFCLFRQLEYALICTKVVLGFLVPLYLALKDSEFTTVILSKSGLQEINGFRKILKEMRWEEIKNAGTIEEEMQSVFFTDQRITKQEVNHCLIFKKKMPDVIVIRKGMEDKKLMELVEKYKDETLVHKG